MLKAFWEKDGYCLECYIESGSLVLELYPAVNREIRYSIDLDYNEFVGRLDVMRMCYEADDGGDSVK